MTTTELIERLRYMVEHGPLVAYEADMIADPALAADALERMWSATPPAWPENARFQYGDAARVIVKREGQPRFPGYVIGWYRPMDGRHTGWVLEHERDGIIHVYPDAAVEGVQGHD